MHIYSKYHSQIPLAGNGWMGQTSPKIRILIPSVPSLREIEVRVFLCFLTLFSLCGCSSIRSTVSERAQVSNPVFVRSSSADETWEQVVEVLHRFHFEIERENRQARTIETKYRVGSGVFEPWHPESVGLGNRLESTLQSIRRKVVVTVSPSGLKSRSGFSVQVVALKEQEDLDAIAANSPGGATFQEHQPLDRDLTPVLGQSRPNGWIPLGRDLDLERAILVELNHEE